MSSPAVHTPIRDCLHCGLPLSPALQRRGDAYCCAGCETVHTLIAEGGLDAFYTIRRGPGVPPVPTREPTLAWLDALPGTSGGGVLRLTLDVQGVHCAACVWLLQSLFQRHRAGRSITVNPATGKIDLIWDTDAGDLGDWIREAAAFGYRVGPSRKPGHDASRGLLVRLGISAAAAMNVMILSLCYYLGLSPADGFLYPLFGWLSLALATVAVLAGGTLFARRAVQGLRRRLVHLDLPIAAGIFLAYSGSVLAFLRRGPEASYFDSVSVFVTLMLLGRWLQERVLARNRNAVLAETGIEGLTGRRHAGDHLETVPVEAIRPGDHLSVVAGDVAPVRGILASEAAALSLAWIDGESRPVTRVAGEEIPAGAVNAGNTPFRFEAGERFETSRLQLLLGSPSPGREEGPGRALWSRFSTVYVVAVFVLAAAGFLLRFDAGVDDALRTAVAVLVVTCPCALGLATPLAYELAHLGLRRRGVFVRSASFLERARAVRKVVFDKTGTLTLGRPALTESSVAGLSRLAPEDRGALADLVARSNHPLSRALAEALAATEAGGASGSRRLAVTPDAAVTETPGQGMELRNGRRYRLGRRAFAVSGTDGSGSATPPTSPPATGDSGSEAVFAADGRELETFAWTETAKADAAAEIRALGDAGRTVYILSGDRTERVQEMATRLGVPADRARGGMTPEGKLAWLRDLDRGDTLMVGDGLNDAPVLAAATCSGTPALDHPAIPARTDFFFLGESLAAVRWCLAAARRLDRVVRINLSAAVAYNLAAVTFCFLGWVTPLTAAVLMPLSSISLVVFTSATLSPSRRS